MPQVLVVDNDKAIRETARFLLEDEGYEVIEAPDGAAALDLLRMSDQPMVVLLDIVMPRLSGVELLQLVGRDERLIRHAFVVWTASRVPVLPKPFDMDELLEVVARAAERLVEAESAYRYSRAHQTMADCCPGATGSRRQEMRQRTLCRRRVTCRCMQWYFYGAALRIAAHIRRRRGMRCGAPRFQAGR